MSKEVDITEEITNHLEFLGYEVEKLDTETGAWSLARSDTKSNISIRTLDKVTFLTARWSGYQAKALKSKDFYQLINESNQKDATKWYYEVDEESDAITLVIEMDYYGYEKQSFTRVVEVLDSEIRNTLPVFNDFLKTDSSKA